MDKIKAQASKLGQLVFAAETGEAYKTTLVLTWQILRETALLLWLAVCLVFVGGEWFWYTAINLGNQARNWYEGLSQQPAEEKSFSDMGQSLVAAGQNGAAYLLYQAKQQLGIDAEAPTPKTPTPKAKASPEAASAPPTSSTPPSTPTGDQPAAAPETTSAIAAAAEAVAEEDDEEA
jgi:hypothetical protein